MEIVGVSVTLECIIYLQWFQFKFMCNSLTPPELYSATGYPVPCTTWLRLRDMLSGVQHLMKKDEGTEMTNDDGCPEEEGGSTATK
jgi:hypothetical protein